MLKRILWRTCAVLFTFLLIAIAWVIWGPLGSVIVGPLVQRYGTAVVPSLRVGSSDGSLYSGIALNDLELVSGDLVLLSADRLMVRLSWEQLARGSLWLSDLEIAGVRANVDNLQTLAAHYGGQKSSEPSPGLMPIRVMLKDIRLDTPLHSVRVKEGLLAQDGLVMLFADLGGLPVRVAGMLAFSPLEALSVDIAVGSGRASLEGRLMAPFDIKGRFRSIKLGELLSVVSKIEGSGEFEGVFGLQGEGEALKAWGRIDLARGGVAGVPVAGSVPWSYKEGNFVISRARLESLSADIELKVSADLRAVPRADRLMVRGSAKNISMKQLGNALALKPRPEGEGGNLDFWVSADKTGAAAGRLFVRVPELKLDGKHILKNLRTDIALGPNQILKMDCGGEIFGAKLTGRGEARQDRGMRPSMVFDVAGLNLALVATTFPAFASLSPSGLLNLNVRIDNRMMIEGEARSGRLTLSGVRVEDLLASVRYENRRLVLEGLRGRIGKAPLDFSGTADFPTSILDFNGTLKNLDPASVPPLADKVRGRCDVTLGVKGTTRAPEVTVAVTGQENKIADVPVKRLRLSAVYANDRVTIPETVLLVPGGSLAFRGEIGLPKGGQPHLNVSGNLTNLDLKTFSQPGGVKVSGRIEGDLKVSGPLDGAALTGVVRSDRIMVVSTDVRDLRVDFAGTTDNAEIRSLRAGINGGSLEGKGRLAFGGNGKMQVDMKVRNLEVRPLLDQFGIDGGVGGRLDGSLTLSGTPARPELALRVTSPMTVRETLVDRLSLTVSSPAKDKFDINTSGQLGELTVNLKGRVERAKTGWSYVAESDYLDLDQLATAKMPSMKGRLEGKIRARLTGRVGDAGNGRKGPAPIEVLVTIPTFSTAGVQVRNISLPIRVQGDRATVRNASALAYDGKITISADVELPARQWKATARVAGLDIGKASAPFMKEGAIVGSVDVNVNLNGNYGALMMTFARGTFNAGEGYIHKIKALEHVTKDGRLPFAEIRGSFFWDGKDLWLNPGTQATAKPGDPLYRYFAANGALGIPGKGLDLNCSGRFDIHMLDTVLGAMKGVFNMMTGTLTAGGGQFVRQAAAKAIGYTERDFQNVSFQLKGSWQELQLLNLKIDKSLESYLPLQSLNEKSEERGDEERKFKFNLRIPTGPGGGEDSEDMRNQFKKQFLDNLTNQLNY